MKNDNTLWARLVRIASQVQLAYLNIEIARLQGELARAELACDTRESAFVQSRLTTAIEQRDAIIEQIS